ncbi:cytochrome P450 [Mycena sp. CBHHK59/15]|nr:cytochrome P450 [Mycena sp. CBHHK59/15]
MPLLALKTADSAASFASSHHLLLFPAVSPPSPPWTVRPMHVDENTWRERAIRGARDRWQCRVPIARSTPLRRVVVAAGSLDRRRDALSDIYGLADHEIAHIMIALLLAGQHTGSATLSWTMLHLASRPDIADALYDEQVKCFGNPDGILRPRGYEDGATCPSSTPAITHQVREDVVVPATLAARQRTAYLEGLPQWNLTRWNDTDGVAAQALKTYTDEGGEKIDYGFGAVSKGTESPYQPFGAGKHRCIGEQFAYVQICTIIATMLRRIELRLPTPVPDHNYHTLILIPKDPKTIHYRRSDLRQLSTSITRSLCEQIFTKPIHWSTATNFPESATHAVDFGPVGLSGIGPLTAKNLDGRGVRIIVVGDRAKGDAELYDSQNKELVRRKDELQDEITDFEGTQKATQDNVNTAALVRTKALSDIKHWDTKLAKEREKVATSALVQQESAEWTEKAAKYCEEVQTNRRVDEIERNLRSTQQALQEREKRHVHGASVEDMTIEALRVSLIVRLSRWQEFGRHIALCCKLGFGYHLSQRGAAREVLTVLRALEIMDPHVLQIMINRVSHVLVEKREEGENILARLGDGALWTLDWFGLVCADALRGGEVSLPFCLGCVHLMLLTGSATDR